MEGYRKENYLRVYLLYVYIVRSHLNTEDEKNVEQSSSRKLTIRLTYFLLNRCHRGCDGSDGQPRTILGRPVLDHLHGRHVVCDEEV